MGNTPVTLTIFRGHEQVLGETVAHWKGRVVGAEVEGVQDKPQLRIRLQHPAPRRCPGKVSAALSSCAVRARLRARHCAALAKRDRDGRLRHCRDDPRGGSTAGRLVPRRRAAVWPAAWFHHRACQSKPSAYRARSRRSPPHWPIPAPACRRQSHVTVAPGCDLRAETCAAKFGNHAELRRLSPPFPAATHLAAAPSSERERRAENIVRRSLHAPKSFVDKSIVGRVFANDVPE